MKHTFFRSQSGAVTVDWVVLTAGLVGLGLATMAVVSTGVQDTSGDINDQLQADDIIRTSFETPVDLGYRDFDFQYWGNHPGTAHPDYDFQAEVDGQYANAMELSDDDLMRQERDRRDQTQYLSGNARAQAHDVQLISEHEMTRRGLDPLPSCWPPVGQLDASCS